MIRAMWTAATGITVRQINVDTIAHNLANVNTNSFKRSARSLRICSIRFSDFLVLARSNVGVFPGRYQVEPEVRPTTVGSLQGNMRQTNN